MANIINNIRKNITLNNEIKVDDVIVKGQQATINSDTQDITFSDWINDMDLYKANRVAIRQKEAEFEDMAFEEQEKLIETLAE
ncbi:hypothetical protein KEC48_03555 [Clostridium sp. C1]|uniref:hypothetical protein n=1 Tax=Clostridium sp. C1 TaxID=1155388 RepID=UPI001BA4F199|nr:hypothetical protein [Clostridium sp. C1]QUN13614.1 hypothetical protein KEC48_03555 [Clostridium sp. C1]